MNDDEIIDRLRSALDEVAGSEGGVPVTPDSTPAWQSTTNGPRRTRVLVSAGGLLVAAVVATGWIVVSRNNGGLSSTPLATTPATITPATIESTPTTTTYVGATGVWYELNSPGLDPHPIEKMTCCPSFPAPGPATVMAWAATTGFQDGILLLIAEPSLGGPDVVKYMSYGLTNEQTDALKRQIVPGSGLPYVLPDPSMELIGFGIDVVSNLTSQRYSSSIDAAGRDTVTISVGDYRGQLTPIVLGAGLHRVTIAGQTGYRYSDELTGVHVVWRTPEGSWATLDIGTGLANRADELIAAVHVG